MRSCFAFAVLSVWSSAVAVGQGVPVRVDSARAEIQGTLRRFYFNLAGQDWEALTADILAAKVVADRPAPASLLKAASPIPAGCAAGRAALIDRARITLEKNWAEITVPHCSGVFPGTDRFRLIHFQGRWRFVYIDLFEESFEPTDRR